MPLQFLTKRNCYKKFKLYGTSSVARTFYRNLWLCTNGQITDYLNAALAQLRERFTATFRLCSNGQITDYLNAALAQLPERFTATFRLCTNGQITDYLNAALAQLVERNLAKVEVTSSSLVCRSNFSPKEIVIKNSNYTALAQLPERFTATFRLCSNGQITDYLNAALAQLPERFTATFRLCINGQITDYLNAALAQLVERNLAKVEVTSSSLVCRSNFSAKEIVIKNSNYTVLAQLPERFTATFGCAPTDKLLTI